VRTTLCSNLPATREIRFLYFPRFSDLQIDYKNSPFKKAQVDYEELLMHAVMELETWKSSAMMVRNYRVYFRIQKYLEDPRKRKVLSDGTSV
jgi:hypothetical protein